MIAQLISKFDPFDHNVLLFLKSIRRRPLNFFFLLLTWSGTGQAWFTVATLLNVLHFHGINFTENQPAFLRAFFAPFSAWIIGMGVKRLVARKRPSKFKDEDIPLIPPPSCGSFPSTHTGASVSFFLVLLSLGHPLTVAAGVWSALVSFSRIYLGVHYFTDILGGVVLGIVSYLLVSGQYF